MNIGVEVTLIAAGAAWAAVLRDLYIRKRVEKSEDLARLDRLKKEETERQDRLKKEQFDREAAEEARQQAADLAVISGVPAWMALEATTTERELLEAKRTAGALQEQNHALEGRIQELASKELSIRDETLKGFGVTATEMFAMMAVPGAMDCLKEFAAQFWGPGTESPDCAIFTPPASENT